MADAHARGAERLAVARAQTWVAHWVDAEDSEDPYRACSPTATVEEGRRIAADPALSEDWRRSVIDIVNGHDARETAVHAAEPWLRAWSRFERTFADRAAAFDAPQAPVRIARGRALLDAPGLPLPFERRIGAIVADSGPTRSPNPAQADHRFRFNPITNSGRTRSPVPVPSRSLFRGGRNRSGRLVWRQRLDVVMRQTHRAGEKLFVDYAGQSVSVVERTTGELRKAQIFVAVLGASNYTFAEATWTQALPNWCASHVRALRFFHGVPELVIPDNLAPAVTRPHRFEPDAHPTYTDLAEHYGFAILPARVRRPRDKAKVEVGVQIVERWILAALRHRTFFSLAELNHAIAERLEWLNARAFRKLPGSRRTAFESIDRPALRALTPLRCATTETESPDR